MKERPAILVCLISIAVLAPIIFTACIYVPLAPRFTNAAGVEFKIADASQGTHQDELLEEIGAPYERSPDDRYWLYMMSRQLRHLWMTLYEGDVAEGKPRTGVILVEFDEDGVSKQMRQYLCKRKKADAACNAENRLCAMFTQLKEQELVEQYC